MTNFFELKKEQKYTGSKNIRNLSRRGKETRAIKDGKLRDIKNLCEHEEKKKITVNL